MNSFRSGIHIHYKGGFYIALYVCETHNHNGDLDVVYYSLTHEKHITRPFARDSRNEDSWTDVIIWEDGEKRRRFMHIKDMTKVEIIVFGNKT